MYLNGELSKLGSGLTDNCQSLTPPPPNILPKRLPRTHSILILFIHVWGQSRNQNTPQNRLDILTTFQSKKVFLSVMLTCVIPTASRYFFEETTFNSQY